MDTLLGFYKAGESAEDLAAGFPAVPLSDIHAVISYYLSHREEVEAYLGDQNRKAGELRAEIESQPGYREFREELSRRAREKGLR